MQVKQVGKKGWIILAVIAVVVTTGYIFYRIKKGDFLDHGLQNMVNTKTGGIYKLTYDSIYVDEAGGDLYLKNLRVKGDTAAQLRLIKNGDTNAAKVIFDILIPVLRVSDFKTAAALLSKQLDCREVIISDPRITVYIFPGQGEQKDPKKQQEELYKQILGQFELIKADSVSILNADVVASDFFTKEIKFRTFNTSVNLTGLAIDSSYNQDTSRTLFCKEIKVRSDKVILGEKNNTAEITNAVFDTRSKTVAFSRFDYDAFKNKGFFKSTLEGISLHGISWTGPVENSDLVIDKVVFNKGNLEMLSPAGSGKEKPAKKDLPILTGWIKSFSLNSLQLKALTFVKKSTDPQKKDFTVENTALLIKNIQIDRTTLLNKSLVSKAKEIELSNEEISIKSGDNMYEYKFLGIKVNTRTKNISLKAWRVVPQLDEAAFAKKAKYQKDRYDINFRNINCRKVDIEKLMDNEIVMDVISTSNNTVHVFHDMSYPIDSTAKEAKHFTFPHQLLYTLDMPVKVNRFIANQTYIEYKEKNAKSKSSGRVRFSNTDMTVTNITNHKPKAGEKTIVRFTANFLEKIPVSGAFTFYLDDWKKGKFMVDAVVNKSFDAIILNQLTQPMALAKIEKGVITSLKFNAMADTSISQGSLVLPYNNMKITLLKKKEGEYRKKGVFSLLANVIVKNKNDAGTGMRTGKVSAERNRYKSFFNLVWKSLFSGLKDVLVIKI